MSDEKVLENRFVSELSKDSPLNTLAIFKDLPLFGEFDDEKESDVFNHEALAETIYKLIKANKPPLSIGLFGSWGIGKSTIVNLLFQRLRRNEAGSIKPIYFNAWKYSGDSFRRQFLIEVATQVYGPGHEAISRLEQLNYVEVLKQSHQRNFIASLVQAISEVLKVKFAFRSSAVAKFLMGCLAVMLFAGLAGVVARFSPIVATLILTTTIPTVFIWFSSLKFEDVFVLQEAPVYDPKMIFPEQFEKEFLGLVSGKLLKNQKVVIAIDDLDRCEPGVVKDILISMKNFTGHQNCFFVVPCDDKAIVNAFSDANQKRGYEDESLRKYFNVGLRIPPITSTDLVDFANTMARTTGIPEEVVQVAAVANCRDARKMKHFLNGFVMKYQIAKAREASGLMPKIVDANLEELAKVVVIEDAFPDLFARIVENPRVYGVLENAALGKSDDASDDIGPLGLKEWEATYVGLREILRRTRDIPMVHASIFFSLKSSNQEARVPRGTELRDALVEGSADLVDEITKGITTAPAKTATADLLIDLLTRSKKRFLQLSIAGSLRLCFETELFSETDTRRVANAISRPLFYDDEIDVLSQRANLALQCARVSGGARADEMLNKYSKEIPKLLSSFSPPEDVVLLVSSLFEFPHRRKEFAGLFNEKFANWISTGDGLVALDSLGLGGDLPEDERVPSRAVLAKILSMTSPDLPDLPEYASNMVRRKILFANWSEDFTGPYLKTLTKIAETPPSGNVYHKEIAFVIDSVLLKNQLVESSVADQLWNSIQPLYDRVTDSQGKVEIAKAAVIFAAFTANQSIRTSASNFLLSFWGSVSDPALRESLDFLKALVLPDVSVVQSLLGSVAQDQFGRIKSEKNAPTDRTSQRVSFCIDYSSSLAQGVMSAFFIECLEVDSEASLIKWLEIVKSHDAALDGEFWLRFAARCRELAQSNKYDQGRQELLLGTMAEILSKLPQDRRREFVQSFFESLKSDSPNTRNAAAAALSSVKNSISDTEFKIQVSRIVGDLRRDLKTQDILLFRPVIDSLVAQAVQLPNFDWTEVGGLGQRLLPHSDLQLQEYGMVLVDQIPGLYRVIEADLAFSLVGIENSSSNLRARATEHLDRLSNTAMSPDVIAALERRHPPSD